MRGLFFTSIIGGALIILGALIIFIRLNQPDSRISLIAYILESVGIVLLLVRIFSPQILISVFLTGTMGAAILGTDQVDLHIPLKPDNINPQRIFRFLLGLIFAVLILSIEPEIAVWIPVPDSILFCSLFLILMGLTTFSLSSRLMYRFLGILNIFSGFQLVYMLLEESVLVFGFMIAIDLLIALLGAYFMSGSQNDEYPT